MADDPKLTPGERDDVRMDSEEYDPSVNPPKDSKAWLNLLEESEDAFEDWNIRCDNIDEQYASLKRLANNARDKEFQMFWANCEVIKPSIYAKPPVPVVVPKFKDRRPVYTAASEVMERCTQVAFDLSRINDVMMLLRDDVAMISRGVPWCRYESGKGGKYDHEKVCIDYKNRRDFLHSLSRNWPEVTWVAAASYLTRREARKRFYKTSGETYKDAEYRVDKKAEAVGGADNRERAKFWEIWDKASERVVWVAKGCDKILDDDKPHLELKNFFPCPKPAYGGTQRGSLVPVPDVLQYKDQLEEVNTLTGRIHALSEALEVKGFYPAGGAELAEAVQAAIAANTKGRLLVPISNWAAFGGSKEVIIWLPIDMIAQTITALVTLRKQVIEDIYQIMGLSDIMRGATDPKETLGAQELKTQFGSTRIRDKQMELVRVARDLVEICAEIITEKFDPVTIIEMSQTQLPTQAMVQQQIQQIVQDLQQQQMTAQRLIQNPQAQQMAMQKPDMAQQMMQQFTQMQQTAQQTITKLREKPTIEQVLTFLKNTRAKSFVLDIETDSTIMIDENREKQARGEFIQVLSALIPQLTAMIGAEPKTAEFAGELLKFATAPFRAGRALEGSIDELVEQMKQKSDQPKPDDPITAKAKADMEVERMKNETKKQKDASDERLAAAELKMKDQHGRLKLQYDRDIELAKLRQQQQATGEKMAVAQEKRMENREAHQAHMFEREQERIFDTEKHQRDMQLATQKSNDVAQRAQERQAQQQLKNQGGIIPR